MLLYLWTVPLHHELVQTALFAQYLLRFRTFSWKIGDRFLVGLTLLGKKSWMSDGLNRLPPSCHNFIPPLFDLVNHLKRMHTFQLCFIRPRIHRKFTHPTHNLPVSFHMRSQILPADCRWTVSQQRYQVVILLIKRWFYLSHSYRFLLSYGFSLIYLGWIYYFIVLILSSEKGLGFLLLFHYSILGYVLLMGCFSDCLI